MLPSLSTLPRLALALCVTLAFTACNSTDENGTYEGPNTSSSRTTGTRTSGAGAGGNTTARNGAGTGTTAPAPRGNEGSMGAMGGNSLASGASGRVTLAYPTGDRATSALLLEKTAPTEVRVNQPYEYVINVQNISRLDLQDVVVTETPGEGFSFEGGEGRRAADGSMQWPLGALRAGETKTIRVTGRATGTGSVLSCTEVAYNSRACLETRVVEPNLALTKTAPEKILACDPVTLTYTVTNPGTGTARNVRITDPLPEGWMTDAGAGDLSLPVGDLAAGQSRTMEVRVKAAGNGRMGSAATATADGDLTAASQRTDTTVCRPALEVTKSGPDNRFAGRPIEYEITVKNTGDGEAKMTVVEDMIPAGTTFRSATDGGAVQGNKVVWNLGTLAAGAERSMKMIVVANTTGTIRNTATANAYCAEAASSNVVETQTSGIPAILLEVVDVEDPIEVGTNVTYIITVTNQGSAPGTGITISCELEPELSLVSATGDTRAPAAAGRSFRFEALPSLAPKAQATWRVVCKAEDVANVRFKVTMNSNELDRVVEETESTNLYR